MEVRSENSHHADNDATTRLAEHLGKEHRRVLASGFCSEFEYLRLDDWVDVVKGGKETRMTTVVLASVQLNAD